MEEDLEIIDRGLLSEVNSEDDINDIETGDTDALEVAKRGAAKPTKIANSKVLNYLGYVKESKPYNSRAWLLQAMLNELGYPLTADGYFGPKTDQEAKKFQNDNGLGVDGVVGPASWTRLIYLGRNGIANSKISEQDYVDAANVLGVEVAVVKAIKDVESSGSGYLFNNHPTILFEGHVFWKELSKRKIEPTKYNDSDILYQSWTKEHYKGNVAEYARLEKARQINSDAANASASWGLFQIMGNNYKACGCSSVSEFVNRMCMSESEQLKLFVAFIKYHHLDGFLQNKEWDKFAARYNGSGYKQNQYDTRLEKAYNKYKGNK